MTFETRQYFWRRALVLQKTYLLPGSHLILVPNTRNVAKPACFLGNEGPLRNEESARCLKARNQFTVVGDRDRTDAGSLAVIFDREGTVNVLRVGTKARQGRQDDTMSEIIWTNLNGSEDFWRGHGLTEISDEERSCNGTIRTISSDFIVRYTSGALVVLR